MMKSLQPSLMWEKLSLGARHHLHDIATHVIDLLNEGVHNVCYR